MKIEWIESRQGLWGLLALLVSITSVGYYLFIDTTTVDETYLQGKELETAFIEQNNDCKSILLQGKISGIDKVDLFTTPNLNSTITEFRYSKNEHYPVIDQVSDNGINWLKIEFRNNKKIVTGWVDRLRTNCRANINNGGNKE